MSSSDENPKHPTPVDLASNGVHRRGFLQFLAAAFATAALPEVLDACGSAVEEGGGAGGAHRVGDLRLVAHTLGYAQGRRAFSLGFQFSGIGPDANHNLALISGTTPGNAFIALTVPPQHVIEDAELLGTTPALPVTSYASGTSRIVFQVPATYGAAADAGGLPLVPYDLQGVLALCARSTTVVGAHAAAHAGLFTFGARPVLAAAGPQSLARAKIDRVVARVDPEAAGRVAARVAAGAGAEITLVLPTHHGTSPVAPASGETSIEIPHRLLLSPNETMAWSYAPAPITSLSTNRTELWNARMGLRNPATGLADPSLGGLAVRALWTRDYDLDGEPDAGATFTNGSEPVANPVPDRFARNSIVQDTGDMSGAASPPLVLGRMMLTPLGGTFDVAAGFPNGSLATWIQRISLGRDQFVETVTRGYLLPFGHVASLVKINQRNDNPANGPVGVLYNTTYLAVGQPLASYAGRSNATDYNTFPFVAVELTQSRIPCSSALNAGSAGWVFDPTGKYNPLIACIGTDHKGRAIRFTTPLLWVPQDAPNATTFFNQGASAWNGAATAVRGTPSTGSGSPMPPPRTTTRAAGAHSAPTARPSRRRRSESPFGHLPPAWRGRRTTSFRSRNLSSSRSKRSGTSRRPRRAGTRRTRRPSSTTISIRTRRTASTRPRTRTRSSSSTLRRPRARAGRRRSTSPATRPSRARSSPPRWGCMRFRARRGRCPGASL